MVGLAPTMRVAADLQSTGVTNFPTYPKIKNTSQNKFQIWRLAVDSKHTPIKRRNA